MVCYINASNPPQIGTIDNHNNNNNKNVIENNNNNNNNYNQLRKSKNTITLNFTLRRRRSLSRVLMIFDEIAKVFNCISECLRNIKCKSVNFNSNRKICQLLEGNTNDDKDNVDKTTVEDEKWVYYGYKVRLSLIFVTESGFG